MSAPPGTGKSRASARSRGSSRGIGRSRGSSNGAGTGFTGRRPPSGTLPSHEAQRNPKPSTKHDQTRNKQWKNPAQLSSASMNHVDKLSGFGSGSGSSSRDQPWRNPATEDNATYKSRMNDLYQALKDNRERERKEAIKNGFLADPNRPTSLANAITPVGTCPDMCPEFERVERIVQIMVDGNEKETTISGAKVPCEALMVKRFRRSAAGYDEQLPSDIRPPSVLKKTLDYLINGVIGGAEPLAAVHKFVWDRTRGIRNDFSIQQVSKTEDIRIAIDCFERIARFHILCLHQLSRTDLKDNEFDHHQEREQLNNTLLSLMYYYDDSRHKLVSPNEAEFRAYCIIFEIQDQRPDLEDRAQSWPRQVLRDPRVQTALKIYAAAGNTSDEQGPLRPRTPFLTAQANCGGFWNAVRSNAVSYLMACVAEIYFNLVRSTALEVIWKAYKGKRGGSTKIGDWILPDLTKTLGFDSDDQTAQFCEEHEFVIEENETGDCYIDLGSVIGGQLRDSNPRRRQIFSRTLVEAKRLSRTLPAIINGLTASQAQSQGLIEEGSEVEYLSDANSESLFINEESDVEQRKSRSRSASPLKSKNRNELPKLNSNPFQSTTVFGQPSGKANPFLSASTPPSHDNSSSLFGNQNQTDPKPSPFTTREGPIFNPFQKLATTESEDKSLANGALPNKGTLGFNPFQRAIDSTSEANLANSSSPTNKKIPTLAFFPSPGVGEASTLSTQNNDGQLQARKARTVFSRPSSSMNGNTSIVSPPQPDPFVTSFDPSQVTLTAKSSTKSEPPSNGLAPSQDEQPLFPPRAETPRFSFGTSPLFQPLHDVAGKAPVDAMPQTPNTIPSQPGQRPLFTNLSNQSPPQSKTDILNKPTTFPSSANLTGPKQFFSPSSPHLQSSPSLTPLQTSLSEPKNNLFPSPKSTTQPDAPEKTVIGKQTSIKPSIQPSKPVSKFSSNPSILAATPEASIGSSTPQSVTKSPRPDIRPKVLDELARNLIYEDGGLLQQFVEYTVAPIIRSSLVRLEDERSWTRARESRAFLLSKKFFERWKSNAWKRGLKRRGKERRRTLAQSIRNNSQSPSPKLLQFDESPFSKILRSKTKSSLSKDFVDMPPPSVKEKFVKTLPARLGEEEYSPSNNLGLVGVKRKREEDNSLAKENLQSNPNLRHKHSSTVGTFTSSAPSHKAIQRSLRKSVDLSRAGDGSLLGNTLMRQARRLAQNAKSDTTQTDYFKLKAMGLDPDTPIVPESKKRPRAATITGGNAASHEKSSALTMHKPPAPSTPSKPLDDEDETFFTSIRSVRDTLADSTSWFQTERQSIERSMTPKINGLPSRSEMPAERRLREFRERGPAPTRAELRQRAIGDQSLLPNELLSSPQANSISQGKQRAQTDKQVSSKMAAGKSMGLAALSEQRQGKEMVNGNVGQYDRDMSPFQQKGALTEDVIEL